MSRQKTSVSGWVLIGLGMALLVITLHGRLWPAFEELPVESWGMGPNDRIIDRLSPRDLDRLPGEPHNEYLDRLVAQVNGYLIHSSRNSYMTVTENYLLWILQQVGYGYFRENAHIPAILRRGSGLCSQHAILVAAVLERNAIAAQVIRLDGHLVASAPAEDGSWHILDADYGIVIPHDLETLERDPDLVASFYEPTFRTLPAMMHLPMADIFGPEGNVAHRLVDERGIKAHSAERIAYVLIWVLPVVLLILGAMLVVRAGRGVRRGW